MKGMSIFVVIIIIFLVLVALIKIINVFFDKKLVFNICKNAVEKFKKGGSLTGSISGWLGEHVSEWICHTFFNW